MSAQVTENAHLTDEQLISHIYGIESQGAHLAGCDDCRRRIVAMQNARRANESDSGADVAAHFLAAQRRAIYARIDRANSSWLPVRRWAPAAIMLVLLTGGIAVFKYDQPRAAVHAPASVSDDELAQQVSQIADNPEPPAAAPIQALFED